MATVQIITRFPVYASGNWFYSDYVSRAMGINCDVVLEDGRVVFTSVQPANEYVKENLPLVGHIEVASAPMAESNEENKCD